MAPFLVLMAVQLGGVASLSFPSSPTAVLHGLNSPLRGAIEKNVTLHLDVSDALVAYYTNRTYGSCSELMSAGHCVNNVVSTFCYRTCDSLEARNLVVLTSSNKGTDNGAPCCTGDKTQANRNPNEYHYIQNYDPNCCNRKCRFGNKEVYTDCTKCDACVG